MAELSESCNKKETHKLLFTLIFSSFAFTLTVLLTEVRTSRELENNYIAFKKTVLREAAESSVFLEKATKLVIVEGSKSTESRLSTMDTRMNQFVGIVRATEKRMNAYERRADVSAVKIETDLQWIKTKLMELNNRKHQLGK